METEPGAREREGPAVPASSRAVTGVGVGGLCGSEGGGGHTRGVGGREHYEEGQFARRGVDTSPWTMRTPACEAEGESGGGGGRERTILQCSEETSSQRACWMLLIPSCKEAE